MRQRPRIHLPALIALALALPIAGSGCVYRMAIQQGNYLDPVQVAQVQVGMTRSQVRFLLGTPMLPDAFDNERWDYLYYLKIGRKRHTEQRRLTIRFADDKVAQIDNQGIDAPKSDAAPAPAAAASGPP
jgi:outer membrane protein assembly factor BamE